MQETPESHAPHGLSGNSSPNPADKGFDFGTRPHGLSVECCRSHQESQGQAEPHSLADGFGSLGAGADEGAPAIKSAGVLPSPEGRQTLGGHTFNFTEEQRAAVAFALLNQIEELEESDEATEPEVVEELHYLESAWEVLRLEGEFR